MSRPAPPSSTSSGVKSIYIARRNPITTHAEFLDNWRAHAKLASAFGSVVSAYESVTQCRALTDGAVDPDIDGVNILGVRSLTDAVALRRHRAIDELRADELRVFASPVEDNKVVAVETVLLQGNPAPFVVIELVQRTPDAGIEDFVDSWSSEHGRALARDLRDHEHATRLVHNHAVLPPPAGAPFDGIGEVWFSTQAAGHAYVESMITSDNHAHVVVRRVLLAVHHSWGRRP